MHSRMLTRNQERVVQEQIGPRGKLGAGVPQCGLGDGRDRHTALQGNICPLNRAFPVQIVPSRGVQNSTEFSTGCGPPGQAHTLG